MVIMMLYDMLMYESVYISIDIYVYVYEYDHICMHTDESHKTHFMTTLKAARGGNHDRNNVIIIIHL
jgi:hypothetical protein